MPTTIMFLRHFKPKIDKTIPVSQWALDKTGVEDMRRLVSQLNGPEISAIYSSPEEKALITSKHISQQHDIPLTVHNTLKEVDRSKVGYIEGDYTKIVEQYLSNDGFDYKWEQLDSVKERAKAFIKAVEHETGTVFVVSHGMFLSILLHEYFKKDIVEFWKHLKFGELIEADFKTLEEQWL